MTVRSFIKLGAKPIGRNPFAMQCMYWFHISESNEMKANVHSITWTFSFHVGGPDDNDPRNNTVWNMLPVNVYRYEPTIVIHA